MAQVRLHVREADGHLPMVCMRCGEPATTTKSKNMSWCPPWVIVLIVASLLPYLIVALILTKRATVRAPFCEQHRWHWLWRLLVILASLFFVLFAGIATIIVMASTRPQGGAGGADALRGFACVASLALFLAWLILALILQNTAIRPREITDTEILLTGVSEAFVEAVEEADRERRHLRRERPRRWEYEEERSAPRPVRPADAIEDWERPRSRPPSDAIEE
jgi:hypothetical protein